MSPRVTQLPIGLVGFFVCGVWETQANGMDNLMKHWSTLSLDEREGGKMAVTRLKGIHYCGEVSYQNITKYRCDNQDF